MATQGDKKANARPAEVDVVVVGAGFAGLYLLYRLRKLGFSVRVIEAADDVGGTWYWNRYPGARCDIATTDYSYSFDPELEKAWTWSEKYATQPEILRYAQFVADRYDLRRDIDFDTRVQAARWDDAAALLASAHRRWRRHHLPPLRDGHRLPVAAQDAGHRRRRQLQGRGLLHQPLAARGRRLHRQAGGGDRHRLVGHPVDPDHCRSRPTQLTVFQRTPNFSIPAGNGPVRPERRAPLEADREAYRKAAKWSRAGVPNEPTQIYGRYSPPEVHRERFEAAWQTGELIPILGVFADQILFPDANAIVAEMVREKIRAVVKDPQTAELLCPKDHPFGTKRPCLDTNYYATFNLPHVRLVDLRSHPIRTITETGIALADETMEFDAIVYATGFDAMTGALVAVDIAGATVSHSSRSGRTARITYLGLMTVGFPELLHHHRAGQPVGAVEHDGVDRAARGLGGRLPGAAARQGPTHDRTHRDRRGRLADACQRLRRDHAVPDRRLLVHGRQRAGQATGVPALRGRRGCLPQDLRRGGGPGLPGIPAQRSRRACSAATA